MNPTLTAAAAASVPIRRTRAEIGHRAMWLVAATACVLMLVLNVFRREGYTGDEGFYGVTAQNMLHAPDYLLRVSYHPLGDFMADRDGFAHPPFNSYAYALALSAARGSLVGPEVLNMLSFAALLVLVYQIAATFDRRAAQFAVLALAASGPMIGYFSMLEAEPLVTVSGLGAILCALRVRWGERARMGDREPAHPLGWVFASGLCLGLSFALKLWLCGPLGLGTVAALALRAWTGRITVGQAVGALAVFSAGFVLPWGAHLAAIAWVHPEDLSFWLRNIYFGVITHAGISGAKMAGDAGPSEWVHPVWYYAAALYRDHFFLVPPIAFGAASLLRDKRVRGGLLVVSGAVLAGLVPLSLMKVKEPLYVLTCAVFLYVVAGACVSAMLRRFAAHRALDRFSMVCGMTITVGLLVLFPFAHARGIQADKITATFVMVHTVVFGVFLCAVVWAHRQRSSTVLGWTLYAACAAAVVTQAASAAVTRVPRDETIVRLVKPYLDPVPAGQISFIASNFKNYQYYSFHTGMYWHELPQGAAPDELLASPMLAGVRVFVLSPEDEQRGSNQTWLRWLETHALEKTDELDRALGRISGYRVFVWHGKG